MVNQIGGNMGLLAGMSLVTGTEYLSLLVMIGMYALMKRRLEAKALANKKKKEAEKQVS